MAYIGQEPGLGVAERYIFTASGGETTVTADDSGLSIGYTENQVSVYLNGVKLVVGTDCVATNGSTITGLSALSASDVVEVIALSSFSPADTVPKTGGTFTGAVTASAGVIGNLTGNASTATTAGTVTTAAQPAITSVGTLTGLTVSGDIVPSTPLSHRNMIINGGMQVSQRGDYTTATAVTHLTYYLDRYQIALDGVTGTIQDMGLSVKLVATSSATGTLRLAQKFEEKTYLSGKTVTLSCQMKSNDANSRLGIYADGWQSTTATHTGGGDWETISMTLTIPSGVTTELSAHFGIDGASSANVAISSGAYCEVKETQLELGSNATPFEHRTYAEELTRCQRYFQTSYSAGVAIGAASRLGGLVNYNSRNLATSSGGVQFRTTMHHAPTVSLHDSVSGSSAGSVYNLGTKAAVPTTIGTGGFEAIDITSGTAGNIHFHYTALAEL